MICTNFGYQLETRMKTEVRIFLEDQRQTSKLQMLWISNSLVNIKQMWGQENLDNCTKTAFQMKHKLHTILLHFIPKIPHIFSQMQTKSRAICYNILIVINSLNHNFNSASRSINYILVQPNYCVQLEIRLCIN